VYGDGEWSMVDVKGRTLELCSSGFTVLEAGSTLEASNNGLCRRGSRTRLEWDRWPSKSFRKQLRSRGMVALAPHVRFARNDVLRRVSL